MKGSLSKHQDVRLRDLLFGIVRIDNIVANKHRYHQKKAFKKIFKDKDVLIQLLRAQEQKNKNLSEKLENLTHARIGYNFDEQLQYSETPRRLEKKKTGLIVIESPNKYEKNRIAEFESFSKENTARKSQSSRTQEDWKLSCMLESKNPGQEKLPLNSPEFLIEKALISDKEQHAEGTSRLLRNTGLHQSQTHLIPESLRRYEKIRYVTLPTLDSQESQEDFGYRRPLTVNTMPNQIDPSRLSQLGLFTSHHTNKYSNSTAKNQSQGDHFGDFKQKLIAYYQHLNQRIKSSNQFTLFTGVDESTALNDLGESRNSNQEQFILSKCTDPTPVRKKIGAQVKLAQNQKGQKNTPNRLVYDPNILDSAALRLDIFQHVRSSLKEFEEASKDEKSGRKKRVVVQGQNHPSKSTISDKQISVKNRPFGFNRRSFSTVELAKIDRKILENLLEQKKSISDQFSKVKSRSVSEQYKRNSPKLHHSQHQNSHMDKASNSQKVQRNIKSQEFSNIKDFLVCQKSKPSTVSVRSLQTKTTSKKHIK